MKQLEENFIGKGQVRGFDFTQIKKSKHAYIYCVLTGTSTHYEVFFHKENNHFNCISYPGDASFGSWAWTYGSLDLAIEKFEELNLRKELQNG